MDLHGSAAPVKEGASEVIVRTIVETGGRLITIENHVAVNCARVASCSASKGSIVATTSPLARNLVRPAELEFLARHIIQNPLLESETIRRDGAYRLETR